MAAKLAKHGTQAGYKAELATGNVCNRCRNAHRIYNQQFTVTGKKNGLRYGVHEVIDHLSAGRPSPFQGHPRAPRVTAPENPAVDPPEAPEAPSLGQRLGALLGSVQAPQDDSGGGYVPSDEPHEYIHAIDPDPSPEGEDWEPSSDEEFVVNAAGMKKIQDNLGFYFTTVGMTLEIFDPYCGAVAAINANNIIAHWSKVIAHYPKTANFFMSEKSGALFAWINALQATWPVLYAIYEHHFARSVEVKDGIIMRKRPDGRPMPDATMPPTPDNYAYSAR